MKIGVIGLGKLGLPLALVFCKAGFEVVGVDSSKQRIEQIRQREGLWEPRVVEYLEDFSERLEITDRYDSLEGVPVVFVMVQTPSLPDKKFNVESVESAMREIDCVNSDCLIVVSSTTNVGDTNRFRKTHDKIAYNPEFVSQGAIIHDFQNPKYTLIGAYDSKIGDFVASIWRKVHNKPIFLMTPEESEATKILANVTFALDISFANIVGMICKSLNVDSRTILDIIYKDRREYNPGLGFGGPCFPRDVIHLESLCLDNDARIGFDFARFLNKINQDVLLYYFDQIRLTGKKDIAILGVAYKLNVPLVYDSQSLRIAEMLAECGFNIHIFDPLAEEEARQTLKKNNVFFYRTAEECLSPAEVVFMGLPIDVDQKLLVDKIVINPWLGKALYSPKS